jgi:hypothetical protein
MEAEICQYHTAISPHCQRQRKSFGYQQWGSASMNQWTRGGHETAHAIGT